MEGGPGESGGAAGLRGRPVRRDVLLPGERAAQSVPVLFHVHHVHQRPVGGQDAVGRVRQRVPRPLVRGVRAAHPQGLVDRQQRAGRARLRAQAQRPAVQRRAQARGARHRRPHPHNTHRRRHGGGRQAVQHPRAPVRPVQAQHRRVPVGQGAQSQGPENHSPSGQADQRRADVWPHAEQGARAGGSDTRQGGEKTIRVSGRGPVPRVCRMRTAHTRGQLQDWRLQSVARRQTVSHVVQIRRVRRQVQLERCDLFPALRPYAPNKSASTVFGISDSERPFVQ